MPLRWSGKFFLYIILQTYESVGLEPNKIEGYRLQQIPSYALGHFHEIIEDLPDLDFDDDTTIEFPKN